MILANKVFKAKNGDKGDSPIFRYVTTDLLTLQPNTTDYIQITIPSITGYHPIMITVNSTSGPYSAFLIITPLIDGYVSVTNPNNVTTNNTITFTIMYMPN